LNDDYRTHARIKTEVMISLAGVAAWKILTGKHDWRGSNKDIHDAKTLLDYAVGSNEELNAYLDLLRIQTRQTLNRPYYWYAIKILANALLKKREIKYREAREIIQNALRAPPQIQNMR
jgi:hypothetical protein